MKILAIRGKNLASLHGEFAVELAEPPFSSAGLFSITGPTGAGKSTLLDALCLALFDRTPRMKGGGVPIGRGDDDDGGRLASGDARSLLRRGTASGWAEVDFSGADGRGYRARWSVHRARERAEGKLQAQTLDFRELDSGQALGGTKTETLAAIEGKLGLSFDQFRRSALLAQGDFAAFLRADRTERSELLERMTGTEIYRELSVAAYRRAQEEERARQALEGEAAALQVLGAEERAAREAELAALHAGAEAARVRREELRAAQAWYQLEAQGAAQEREALEALARAEADWLAGAAARDEWSAVEAAEPLRVLVAAADGAEKGLARGRSAVEASTAAEAGAAAARETAEAAHAAARERLGSAEGVREKSRPDLRRAAELDTRLDEARRLAGEAAQAAAGAGGALESAQAEAGRLEGEERLAAAGLGLAEGWLADHPHLEPLTAQWGRWQRELERYREGHGRVGELSERRAQAAQRAAAAADASTRARSTLEGADGRLAEATAGAARAQAEASAQSAGDLRAERVAWERRRDVLRALADTAARAAECVAGQGEAARAREGAAQERRSAEDRGREVVAQRAETWAALAEAERALTKARASLDLTSQRAGLQPGEPCPLCGSPDHPWAEKGAPTSPFVQAQQARVDELRAAVTALERDEAVCRQRAAHAEQLLGEHAAREGALQRQEAQLQSSWEQQSAGYAEVCFPAGAAAPEAGAAVEEEQRRCARRLDELLAAEALLDELVLRAAKERKTLDRAQAARQRAWEAQAAAENDEGAAAQALRDLDGALDRARELCGASVDELAAAFTGWEGWQAALAADPAAFGRRCEKDVASFAARVAERDRSRARLAELGPKREGARAVTDEKRRALEQRRAEEGERRNAVDALVASRRAVLGGRAAKEVEAELDAAVRREAQGADQAAETLAGAGKGVSEAAGRLAADRQALGLAEEAHRAAGEALDRALRERGLALDTVRQRLALGPAWAAARRRESDEGQKRREGARAVAEERRLRREQHQASGPPGLEEGEVAAAVAAAAAEGASLDESLYRCRHALHQDDEVRSKAAGLLPALDARRQAADLWKGLSELIGSADGNKFRTFAQSLTLDVLLGHANRHLGDLAPRYRLERVPGQDLELQVADLDMGEEVRGVNSLSGGESFLVSLALALGLSSLSSRTARVGSLFIDEGFGSLDPDTLEVALAALDSLQAAGRQVGIISHVPGLAERVGARVQVSPLGAGRSRVEVFG